jgi:hypothetical protein
MGGMDGNESRIYEAVLKKLGSYKHQSSFSFPKIAAVYPIHQSTTIANSLTHVIVL